MSAAFPVTNSGVYTDDSPDVISEALARWLGQEARAARMMEWGHEFLPHYFTRGMAPFHRELTADLDYFRPRRGVKLARIAPRGSAKSTWLTLAYPLRCAVEGTEAFTLILSDSSDQANLHLAHLKDEIENNEHLATAYPDSTGLGIEWRADRVTLRNGAVIQALGTMKRVRGRRNRQTRPSLVVIDDCQDNIDIISEVEREHAWQWLTQAVIPAGNEDTNYLSVGTALHTDSIAYRLATRTPGWDGRVYKDIIVWPDRMDLWAEWERIYTSLVDARRSERAWEFYEANRAEMDRGAVVLWPDGRPLYTLMCRRAEIGPAAFDAEHQGDPHTAEGALWPPHYFDWSGFWFDEWMGTAARTIYFDGSMGKDNSDYQCYAVVGLCDEIPLRGHLLVELHLIRMSPSESVSYGVELCRQYAPNAVGVETNFDAGLLVEEFGRHFKDKGVPLPPQFAGINNTAPKEQRIRRLDPYLARRQIHVRNTPGGILGVSQLRQFPTAAHDDAPDALEGAVNLLSKLFR